MTTQQISSWIADYLCQSLSLTPEQIDFDLTFDQFGLDSRRAAGLIADLSEWLQRDLDLDIIYDHASIAALSNHLSESAEAVP